MRRTVFAAVLLAAVMLPADAVTQQAQRLDCPAAAQTGVRTPTAAAGQPRGLPERATGYDVVVNVPNLCVERLRLEVSNLNAHLALDARVANLIRVHAGADVRIGEVELEIRGVRAEALLLVDLDNVVGIVDRTLTVLDNNPEIVSSLVGTVRQTAGTVGRVADTALQPGGVVGQTVGVLGQTVGNLVQPGGLLSQTVNAVGQTVETTLDASGNLVERTLNTAGGVASSRTVGNLLRLPVLQETTNASGQAVRRVRDQNGAVYEYTLERAGRIANARLVQRATQGQ